MYADRGCGLAEAVKFGVHVTPVLVLVEVVAEVGTRRIEHPTRSAFWVELT